MTKLAKAGRTSAMPMQQTALLPEWFRALFFGSVSAKTISIAPSLDGSKRDVVTTSMLDEVQKGKAKRLRTVNIILPRDRLLQRKLELPASKPSARHAIAELDLVRRTPFKPIDVSWVLVNPQTNMWEQWVAKNADLQVCRKNLASHGYTVRQFLVQTPQGHLPLTDYSDEIAPNRSIWPRINAALLCIALALGLTIWLYPAYLAQRDVAAIEPALTELRANALSLRQEVELLEQSQTQRSDFIDAVIRRPRFVDTLRHITVAMPDDVWVSDLTFQQERITLSGETSSSAAGLVLELSESNLQYAPALSGAVSRTNEGQERFSLTLTPENGG